tara:strand:+ start:1142 stop:1381 length:240 start_codon:yes stop_codon:yes gene_type:complete
MNEVTECCGHAAVYYILTNPDGSIDYEPWEFCPECLECCSVYDKEKIVQRTRLDAILLTQEERNNIIKNTIHRIKEPRE